MATIIAKIFIGKTIGLIMPFSITFKFLTFPLIFSILSIYVQPIRDFLDKFMGLKIKKSEFGFNKFFTSGKTRSLFGLIYLFWIFMAQLFLAPIFSPDANFDLKSGKLTSIPITGIPKILFSTLLLIKGPFKIAKVFSNIGKQLIGNNKNINKLTKIVSIVIGFFMIYLFKRGITPLDMIIILILTILSLFTTIFKTFFKLLQIDFPRITFKNIFTNKYNSWIGILFIAFWFFFTLLVIRNIPGYEGFNEKVSDFIGGEISFVIILLDFFTYLIFPLLLASYLSKSLSKKAKSEEERKQLKRRGFTLGYVFGILLMTMLRNLIPGDKIENGKDMLEEKTTELEADD